MNKIEQAFQNKKAFVAFITGGDPDIETTEKLIIAIAEAGVDVIEIGIPFSDPIAEGIVIQEADLRSLANGCTVDQLFDMVKRIRNKVAIPLLFMTYVNPIFAYGKERFMEKAADAGINGVIVPDLPFEERGELADTYKKYNICQISMVAPTTSDERMKAIAEQAEGFIYCVSSLGVTGMRNEIGSVEDIVARVKKYTSVPCAVGFGISTPEQAKHISAEADGIIVGSAIVRIAAEHGRDSAGAVTAFVKGIKAAIS